MKNSMLTLGIMIMGLPLQAQKVIEKNIDFNGQTISADLKFAADIEVLTWDKNTIYFKADLRTEDGKYLDAYELDIQETSTNIHIISKAEGIFKKFQKEWEDTHKNEKNRYYDSQDYEFNYVLYVPKNARFSVSSINGNLRSDIIEGDFEADLINGNIDIEAYAGSLKLSTINGEIDLRMINTSLTAETIHGKIYADDKLKFITKDEVIGQKVEGSFDAADNSLRLNTINGNMYLRL